MAEVVPVPNEWFTYNNNENLRSNGLGGMANFLNAIQFPSNSNDAAFNHQIIRDLILLIIADTKHDLDVNLDEYEKILSIIISIPGIFGPGGPLPALNTLLVNPDGTPNTNNINDKLQTIKRYMLHLPPIPGMAPTIPLERLVGANGDLGRVTEDAAVVTVGGNDLQTLLCKGNYGSFSFGLRSDGVSQPWTVTNIKFKETLKNIIPEPLLGYIPPEGCVTKPRTSEPNNYDKLYIHDIIQQLLNIAHVDTAAAAAGGVTTYKICLSVDDNTLINKLIENRLAIGQHIGEILGANKVLQINVLVLKESFIDPGNAPNTNAFIPNNISVPRIEINLIRHGVDTPGTINDGAETTWGWVQTAPPQPPQPIYQKLYYSNHIIRAQPLANANTGEFQVTINNPVFPFMHEWTHTFTATTRKTKLITNCITCISDILGKTIKDVSKQMEIVNRIISPGTQTHLGRRAIDAYTRFLTETFQKSYLYMSKRMGDCGLGFNFFRLIQEKGIVNFKETYGTPVCISKDRLAIMFYLLSGINCIKCSVDYSMLSFMVHELNMATTLDQINNIIQSIGQSIGVPNLPQITNGVEEGNQMNEIFVTINSYISDPAMVLPLVLPNGQLVTEINTRLVGKIETDYDIVNPYPTNRYNFTRDGLIHDIRTIIEAVLFHKAREYIDNHNADIQQHEQTRPEITISADINKSYLSLKKVFDWLVVHKSLIERGLSIGNRQYIENIYQSIKPGPGFTSELNLLHNMRESSRHGSIFRSSPEINKFMTTNIDIFTQDIIGYLHKHGFVHKYLRDTGNMPPINFVATITQPQNGGAIFPPPPPPPPADDCLQRIPECLDNACTQFVEITRLQELPNHDDDAVIIRDIQTRINTFYNNIRDIRDCLEQQKQRFNGNININSILDHVIYYIDCLITFGINKILGFFEDYKTSLIEKDIFHEDTNVNYDDPLNEEKTRNGDEDGIVDDFIIYLKDLMLVIYPEPPPPIKGVIIYKTLNIEVANTNMPEQAAEEKNNDEKTFNGQGLILPFGSICPLNHEYFMQSPDSTYNNILERLKIAKEERQAAIKQQQAAIKKAQQQAENKRIEEIKTEIIKAYTNKIMNHLRNHHKIYFGNKKNDRLHIMKYLSSPRTTKQEAEEKLVEYFNKYNGFNADSFRNFFNNIHQEVRTRGGKGKSNIKTKNNLRMKKKNKKKYHTRKLNKKTKTKTKTKAKLFKKKAIKKQPKNKSLSRVRLIKKSKIKKSKNQDKE